MNEVLKQMVEALEWCHGGEPVGTAEAIQAGKKLIAELESQEPVVEMKALADNDSAYAYADGWNACVRKFKDTHPPQRQWVGLTDEEIDELSRTMVKGNKSVNWLCRAIEAKLKEKNT